MRLFLALKIPDSVKKNIDTQIYDLKKEYPYFIWVPYANYHLTLHFFGETELVNDILTSTTDVLYQQKKFYLYGVGLDMLVNKKITIFVKFRKENILLQLAQILRNTFPQTNGFRPFIPHVTVGKTKVPSKQQYFLLQKKLKKTAIDIELKAEGLTLFKTIEKRNGFYYEEIGYIPFPLD